MFIRGLLFVGLCTMATPVNAQDVAPSSQPHLRELCSERPGLSTAVCTVDPGHLQAELGLGNWALDKTADEQEDQIDVADILLRYGIGSSTEIQFGWVAYSHVRTRDRISGDVSNSSGIGDLTLGLKQNLLHPAESAPGFAASILPSVTVPLAKGSVGNGDWSAGLLIPLSYKFDDMISVVLSPEIDAAADEDGEGRHLSYGAAMGMQVHVREALRLSPELQFIRDDDPEQSVTRSAASLSIDMRIKDRTQFDVQAVTGLNHNTADVMLSFGITHKF